jgi:hypothetical protein
VPLTPSGKLFALRSLCAALRADFEAATGTAAAPRQGFTALALAKGSLLHDIEADGRRRALVRCARSAFRGVLSCANEAPGRYAAAVLALENPGPPACAIAGAVLDPRLRLAEQPATREAWLGLYASAVIGSAQPPTVGMQWAFAPVLTTATEAEWSKTLLPAALKALKRTPDAVLALMPPLLEALPATVPIGASMPSLLEALQQRHKKRHVYTYSGSRVVVSVNPFAPRSLSAPEISPDASTKEAVPEGPDNAIPLRARAGNNDLPLIVPNGESIFFRYRTVFFTGKAEAADLPKAYTLFAD